MATHSSTLAWKIPGMEEPGRLQSMGSLGVRRLSDFTFTFHFSLSCIGEGNGNPLQCSCLENPKDGGACWAAISGLTQSRTWLKRLSSDHVNKRPENLTVLCAYFYELLPAPTLDYANRIFQDSSHQYLSYFQLLQDFERAILLTVIIIETFFVRRSNTMKVKFWWWREEDYITSVWICQENVFP